MNYEAMHELFYRISEDGFLLRGIFSDCKAEAPLFLPDYVYCKKSDDEAHNELARQYEESVLQYKRKICRSIIRKELCFDANLARSINERVQLMHKIVGKWPVMKAQPYDLFEAVEAEIVKYDRGLFDNVKMKGKNRVLVSRHVAKHNVAFELDFGRHRAIGCCIVTLPFFEWSGPFEDFSGFYGRIQCANREILQKEIACILPHIKRFLEAIEFMIA